MSKKLSSYSAEKQKSRAVKQKVWNEAENRERDLERDAKRGSRASRVRLLRHALPISLLILRRKTTVLQSKDSQVFFFCKRTNDIHKFEVCFLRGEVTSNGFKVFSDCIVEP